MNSISVPGGRRIARRSSLVAALLSGLVVPVLPTAALAAPVGGATASYVRADRALVSAATALTRCRTAKRTCTTAERRLATTGVALSAAQRRLPAGAARASAVRRSSQAAPVLSTTGTTLRWSRVSGVKAYLLLRKAAGTADRYTVVAGTSVSPAALTGRTARYSVRTVVLGSASSRQATISYSRTGNPRAALELAVDGRTLRWSAVASAPGYEFVTKVPGAPARYEKVRTTALVPTTHPGKTVRYSVRTDVASSEWAPERTIAFPAGQSVPSRSADKQAPSADVAALPTATAEQPRSVPAATATAPDATPAPAGTLEFGINSGSALEWEFGFIKALEAKHIRAEFAAATSVATMAPVVEAYAKAGVKPLLLAGFHGRVATAAEVANVATWAAAFGPGGTFWVGKSYPSSVQITEIEFGNELNNPSFYPAVNTGTGWHREPTFLQRARDYAVRVREVALAVKAANAGVGILAVGDQYAGYTTWVDAMFESVPDLGSYVKGWTVHPYGQAASWRQAMDTMIAATRAHGAPDLPLYATEMGLATDDGRCLSDNFGWNACMSYAAAASALQSTVASMRERYGARLASIYAYSGRDLARPGAGNDREHFFGALQYDGKPKGEFTAAVKTLLARSS